MLHLCRVIDNATIQGPIHVNGVLLLRNLKRRFFAEQNKNQITFRN